MSTAPYPKRGFRILVSLVYFLGTVGFALYLNEIKGLNEVYKLLVNIIVPATTIVVWYGLRRMVTPTIPDGKDFDPYNIPEEKPPAKIEQPKKEEPKPIVEPSHIVKAKEPENEKFVTVQWEQKRTLKGKLAIEQIEVVRQIDGDVSIIEEHPPTEKIENKPEVV